MRNKDQNEAPIFVKKIDFIYDFLKALKVENDNVLNKFRVYIFILLLISIGSLIYETRDLKDRINYLEISNNMALSSFDMYKDNIDMLINTPCLKCHSSPSMIMSKMVLHYEDADTFIKYVRVGGKSKNGITMPAIKKKEISDKKLSEIFIKAKKW